MNDPHEHWITGEASPLPSRIEKMNQYPGDTRESVTRQLFEDVTVLIETRTTADVPITLIFTTHDQPDRVYVHYLNDVLVVDINDHRYHLPRALKMDTLLLRTLGGNDTIEIGYNVTNPVIIDSGQGDDLVLTGAGPAQVYAGPGDDRILTGDGRSYIEAGDGDDDVRAYGHADMTVYGGEGRDHLQGGAARSFIDGGDGDDEIIGGRSHNILSGGDGNDRVVAGPASNALYAGNGFDEIDGLKSDDILFATPRSSIAPVAGGTPGPARERPDNDVAAQLETFDWRRFTIIPQDLDTSSLRLEGSDAFKTRVNDDLKLLASSGAGQKLLHALSRASHQAGAPVTIKQLSEEQNGYFFGNDPQPGHDSYITGAVPGSRAPGGTVFYNPSFRRDGLVSLGVLYHELCHAYNYLTGTVFRGDSLDGEDGEKPREMTSNAELQAVGLPVQGQTFDFDNDPNTPALNTNPEPFSENGIRQEFGLPLRKQYNP